MEIIRTQLDESLEAIMDIGRSVFDNFYSKEHLFDRLESKKSWIYIAKNEETVTGFKIWYESDGEIYSWLGAVLPKYRRQGIANALMEKQIELARQDNYNSITLKTHKGHPEMIALCDKFGFFEQKRETNHFGKGLDAIFLTYKIK